MESDKLTKTFWLYVAFTFVTTLGFASWAILGFHFKSKGILSDAEIPLFGLSSSKPLAIAAAVVWGIVMGTHETIMKSAIADITPMKKRGTGYGVFNSAYGLAWAIGLAVAAEIAALAVFVELRKEFPNGSESAIL